MRRKKNDGRVFLEKYERIEKKEDLLEINMREGRRMMREKDFC